MYYRQQSIYDAAGGGSYTNVKTAFDVGYEACLLYTSDAADE